MSDDVLALGNAICNGASASLAALGLHAIKTGRRERHRALMLAAFAASTLFLIGYLTRWALFEPRKYAGTGGMRTLYFAILIPHMILAAAIVPMILRTLQLATQARFAEHRRLARWTFPLWMYVSITGIVIYFMLYQ